MQEYCTGVSSPVAVCLEAMEEGWFVVCTRAWQEDGIAFREKHRMDEQLGLRVISWLLEDCLAFAAILVTHCPRKVIFVGLLLRRMRLEIIVMVTNM